MSIESVMPSNHLILCCPLLLLPSSFPVSGSLAIAQFHTTGEKPGAQKGQCDAPSVMDSTWHSWNLNLGLLTPSMSLKVRISTKFELKSCKVKKKWFK